MDRRLKTEKDAISLATSGILKQYKTELDRIEILETKYDDDAGDWYVALGWDEKRAIVKMDSVLAKITAPLSRHVRQEIGCPIPFSLENIGITVTSYGSQARKKKLLGHHH